MDINLTIGVKALLRIEYIMIFISLQLFIINFMYIMDNYELKFKNKILTVVNALLKLSFIFYSLFLLKKNNLTNGIDL